MTIYIASHKFIDLPTWKGYKPLYVGAYNLPKDSRPSAWAYDDQGDETLSHKNSQYCELTGLYWMWKYCSDETVGLMYYRRVLCSSEDAHAVLTTNEINNLLETYDMIVTKQSACVNNHARLISEAEDYRVHHVSTDLVILRNIIKSFSPDYLNAFDTVMQAHGIHPCNIFICRKSLFEQYAQWLFMILDHLEEQLGDVSYRGTYQMRVFGFISERLMNVFIVKNNLQCKAFDMYDPLDSWKKMSFNPPEVFIPREHLDDNKIPQRPYHVGLCNYRDVFDYKFYLNHNMDLIEKYRDRPKMALKHFLDKGLKEDRMSHPCFSITSYVNGHPELREQFGDDRIAYVHHYLKHPCDRTRAIGFENTPIEFDTIISKSIRQNLIWQKAEQTGVID